MSPTTGTPSIRVQSNADLHGLEPGPTAVDTCRPSVYDLVLQLWGVWYLS